MSSQPEQALAGVDDDAASPPSPSGGDATSPPRPALPPPQHDAPYGAELAPPAALPPQPPPSRTHARRPAFHVSASGGFCSDPAGPVFWRGWYHIFFQHQPKTCQWHWGLGWAHAASRDLVRWVRLPPALVPGPEPSSLDADGCFSGTASVDPATGWPTLLYTGVFLKANEAAAKKHGVTPPHGAAPYTRFVESQLAAVPAALLEEEEGGGDAADDDQTTIAPRLSSSFADSAHAADPLLVRWAKLPEPVVRWPPSPEEAGLKPGQKLACWRDPWLVCGAVGGVGGGGMRPSLEASSKDSAPLLLVPPPPPRDATDDSNADSSAIKTTPLAPGTPPPTLLLCSGTVDRATDEPTGGAVLAFSAPDGLAKPWRCLGLAAEPVAASSEEEEGNNDDKDDSKGLGCSLPGRDWEMPRVAWIPLRRQRRRRRPQCEGGGGGRTGASSSPSPSSSSSSRGLHALVMSPDACDQAPVYALGHWDAPPKARFDLRRASGPWPLDLGRTFYAATVWEQPLGDPSEGGFLGENGGEDGGSGGRTLLWGWLQEHRPEVPPPPALSGEFDHAGCLSLPRVLTLVPLREEEGEGAEEGGVSAAAAAVAEAAAVLPARPPSPSRPLDPRRYRIFQEPLPELAKLRSPTARWAAPAQGVVLAPGSAPLRVGVVNGGNGNNSKAVIQGTHLDIEAEFEPVIDGAAAADGDDNNNRNSAVVAVAFRSWRPDGAGAGVLSYDWRTGELAFAFDDPQPTAYDERPFVPAADVAAARRRVGGKLSRPPKPGEPLRLRVLVDGSVVEVFTGGGEVLSTRIYRGEPILQEEEEKGEVGGGAAVGVAAPPTPTGSEQGGDGGAVSRPPAVAPPSPSSTSKAPCPCACGVEVLASGAPVRVRRLEAWEVLKGCLDPLLLSGAVGLLSGAGLSGAGVTGAAEGTATTAPAAADLSSSSMASLLAAVTPVAAEEEGKLTAAEIGRAAIAAVEAAEREAEELAQKAAKGAAATTSAAPPVAVVEDTPLSPPPTRQTSMLEIPAVRLDEEKEQQQSQQQQQQAPPTPELSAAFLRAIDLRDAAREEDARQAAMKLAVQAELEQQQQH